jgi:hypothetical protein
MAGGLLASPGGNGRCEADDARVADLIEQLASDSPRVRTAACLEIGALGEEGAAAGTALVALLVRGRSSDADWRAAADALEQVAPQVHPHVLTILLNDDSRGQARLGAGGAMIELGAAGAASLPALWKLWNEPTNNYKQAKLLEALHAVAPRDPEVSQLILQAARGDLDQVLLGRACRGVAVQFVAQRGLPDEDVNAALTAAVVSAAARYPALTQLVERANAGHAEAAQVAELCLKLIVIDATANRGSPTEHKALVELGAGAKGILPGLRELRFHPEAQIRTEVQQSIAAIEQAVEVGMPSSDEVWEITDINKTGRITIRSGEREAAFAPVRERIVVFDAAKQRVNQQDTAAQMQLLTEGGHLQVQFSEDKVIAIWLVE